jgi:UDPglucose 6-dehydrogenase
LTYMAEVNGLHPQLLRAVMEINRDQRRQVIVKLRSMLGSLRDMTIGLLGLAFKPNTDDIREAASIEIIHLLTNEGARVRAYDPVAMEGARRVLDGVALCSDPYELAREADALVLVTEWNEFKQLDLPRLARLMRRRVFIDGRNVYDPKIMQESGFDYRGVGRGTNNPPNGS